jgi:hypothetical protein
MWARPALFISCPFHFFQVLASCHRTVGQDDMSSTEDGRKEQELTELQIEFWRCNTLDYLSTWCNYQLTQIRLSVIFQFPKVWQCYVQRQRT